MPLILCIETSTHACSVALYEGNKLLIYRELITWRFAHAEKLNPFIGEIIRDSGQKWTELTAVAVSQGPGSYTGLRIGVSAAKGFCYALDIPLITVDTLLLIAKAAKQKYEEEELIFLPMIDARRMEVYTAAYDNNLNCIENVHPEIVDENSFKKFIEQKKVIFCGNGADKCRPVFQNNPNAVFAEALHPLASNMGEFANGKFMQKNFADVAYFEPFYLKEFHTGAK